MEYRKISALRRHPLNEKIYGDNPDSDLVASIKHKGILTPVLITETNTIISGHSRCAAAKINGMEEVPVSIYKSINEIDIREALLDSNEQREKSNEQKAREYQERKKIEAERAKLRQGERTDLNIRENFPQSETGKAADIAAEKVGWSGRTAEKAKQVIVKIDELELEGEKEDAEQLKTELNKSVSKAHANKDIRLSKATFNKTNDNIGWAKWTWNPVTGCKHNCQYCYAKDISKRLFDDPDFEPTFHEDRLDMPKNTKPNTDVIGGNLVFVCSMADLFGEWVPNDWISAIMQEVKNNPQWTFIFLTKNPRRYESVLFPDNVRVGATVDCQSRVSVTEKALSNTLASKKFISCEPLSEKIVFNDLSMIDYLIIGARSRAGGLPGFQPEWDWVLSLCNQAKQSNIKSPYWKDNLERPKYFE